MDFHYTFPAIDEQVLSNGIRTVWLPDFRHQVLTVTLQIPSGRFFDSAGFEGTAELTAGLMLKGPSSLTSEEFAEKLEHAGATLFADVKEEYTIIGVRILFREADTIVPLFWEMVTEPSLDAKEFNRLKKEMLTGLQAEFADPSILANRHFNAALFGYQHPAGRNRSMETVKRITLAQVTEFYTKVIGPVNCCLVVAGACTIEDMKNRWEHLFENWHKSSDKDSKQNHTVSVLTENRIRIIDKPEYSQATVILGHQGIPELHKNRIPLAIANYILGGGNFSSRLMARIRTETGKTYGINSQLNSLKHFGTFTIETSTQTGQLGDVIRSIVDVYTTFIHSGPTEEEIKKAKQFVLGNMAFELEGLNNVVEKLLWLRFYGRENSYIENFSSLINPIDANLISQVLQSDFAFSHFVIVAVGRETEITAQLKEFGSPKYFKPRDNPFRK